MSSEYFNENAIYWIDFEPVYMTRENTKTIKENLITNLDLLNQCNCCLRHKNNRVCVKDYVNGVAGDFPDRNTL